ncbi:molybdenum cofactor guanylyltransferase MobA [Rhizobium sp.]|uniref:molybdenum cofactor guanylyltransferase MobA n=1 Tax=Rhizobium sp. TaxID=391 RepID=UPI0028B174F4
MRPPGLILAGGRSSRMGANKALLPLGDKSVLGHVIRRLAPQVSDLAVNANAPFPGFENYRYLADDLAGQLGPLAGILTGMRHYSRQHSEASHFASAPCDSPFLPSDLVPQLSAVCPDPETIVIATSLERRHPVFGLWPIALAEDLEHWLTDSDNRRINAFLNRHRTVTVDFPSLQTRRGMLDPFFNINTPEELTQAAAFTEILE